MLLKLQKIAVNVGFLFNFLVDKLLYDAYISSRDVTRLIIDIIT